MPTRTVATEAERDMAATWIQNMAPPFVLSAVKGSPRSLQQNNLSHKWYQEIADQRGDMTEADVRAECKLVFGVPILRAENPAFKETYDRVLKPLPYETKIEFIKTTELPVTRLMTTKQLSQYLDAVWNHFTAQGIILTDPERRAA